MKPEEAKQIFDGRMLVAQLEKAVEDYMYADEHLSTEHFKAARERRQKARQDLIDALEAK